ncbi:MAG TPA: PsiF family protein [Roseiarcus sp.]
MNIRVLSLVCAGALSLIASETLVTFGAAARTTTAGMSGVSSTSGGPAAPAMLASEPLAAANLDPAERSARSIECAQKADAQGLQGKIRKDFLRECKRGS